MDVEYRQTKSMLNNLINCVGSQINTNLWFLYMIITLEWSKLWTWNKYQLVCWIKVFTLTLILSFDWVLNKLILNKLFLQTNWTKVTISEHKMSCKSHQRSNLRWLHLSKFISSGVLTMWKVSYFYHEMHNFWVCCSRSTIVIMTFSVMYNGCVYDKGNDCSFRCTNSVHTIAGVQTLIIL